MFNIGIKSTDDYLRNHGVLLTTKGWILSPTYDVNPVYYGNGLTLNISETDNSLDFELARPFAPYFRVKDFDALKWIEKVKYTREKWRLLATKTGISRQEQELMESAFTDT